MRCSDWESKESSCDWPTQYARSCRGGNKVKSRKPDRAREVEKLIFYIFVEINA